MSMRISDNIARIVSEITSDYEKGRAIDQEDIFRIPDGNAVQDIIEKLNHIVFAGYHVDRTYRIYNLSTTIASVTEDVAYNLQKQIALALRFDPAHAEDTEEALREAAEDLTIRFLE